MKRWILGIVVICAGVMFIIGIRLGSKSTVPSINSKNKPLKEGIIPHEVPKAKIEVKQEEKVLNVKDWIDPREIEVTPDGITLAEVEQNLKGQDEIDPNEIEVTPPENGKRGLTLAEVEEIIKQEKEIDPRDIEVIPPEHPGEKGVTVGEIEEIIKQQKEIDTKNIEPIPPD